MSTAGLWYHSLAPTAASEAAVIVNAFREDRPGEPGIEILGVPDPANPDGYRDDDVEPNGIGFMYAEGHILARAQYLEQVRDVLQRNGAPDPGVSQIVDGILLLTLDGGKRAHENDNQSAESDESNPESGYRPTEGDGGTAQGNAGTTPAEPPSVLFLLDRIDEELGPGIATPDHVLTASNGEISNCPATEPEEFYGPRDPYPPVRPDDGGRRVRIFIADTGLLDEAKNEDEFPWLKDVRGETDPRLGPDGKILPYAGHGTFVAGVIRCMAPGATIYVANIFNRAGSALESHFVRRLNEAFKFGFEILHVTASCLTRNNGQLIALDAWLGQLRSFKGVICIAPAGNNHTRRPSWPGALPGVLSVGALSTDWCRRAYFTNYGSWVDVYAPGQNLINAYASGDYKCKVYPFEGETRKFRGRAQWSGTSFSTPIVTGLIAARMARCGENAEEAAAALLAKARTRRIPGAGPALLPGCDDEDHGCCRAGPGRCDGDCGRCSDGRRCGDSGRCGGECDRCAGGRGRGWEGGHGRDRGRPGWR
jgi:subtilisin family serine protease